MTYNDQIELLRLAKAHLETISTAQLEDDRARLIASITAALDDATEDSDNLTTAITTIGRLTTERDRTIRERDDLVTLLEDACNAAAAIARQYAPIIETFRKTGVKR